MKLLKASLLALFLSPLSAIAAGEGWLTDLEEAKKVAKKENKSILIDFTGSDWCHFCVLLDDEVFSKDDFMEKAKKDFVLVEIDFPRKAKQSAEVKAKNEALAKKYGVQGFPTVFLTDENGKPFAKTGYQRGGVKPYLAHLEKALKQKGLN